MSFLGGRMPGSVGFCTNFEKPDSNFLGDKKLILRDAVHMMQSLLWSDMTR